MFLIQNAFRTIALAVLLGLFMSPALAQGTCDPGFISPDCKAEATKVEYAGCMYTKTKIDRSDPNNPKPVFDDQGKPVIEGRGKDCDSFIDDLTACQAQCIPSVTNGGILPGPKDGSTAGKYLLENFLPNITNAFLVFNMVIAVLFLVISGIMWIMASGSEEMKEKAKNTIVWAIIGLTVSVLAYVLVQFVININFFT